MPLNIQHLKTLKKIAGALLAIHPGLTAVQILNKIKKDIELNMQTLAGIDYLGPIKNVGITPADVDFLIAQEMSKKDSQLVTYATNFNQLMELRFTPNEGLNLLIETKRNISKVFPRIRLAVSQIHVLTAGNDHMEYLYVWQLMLDKENQYYIANLTRSDLETFISPGQRFEFEVGVRTSHLLHSFQELLDYQPTINESALEEIARQQVLTNDFSETPRLKALKDKHNTALMDHLNIAHGITNPSPEVFGAGGFLPHAATNSPIVLRTASNWLYSTASTHPAETVILGVFLMLGCSYLSGLLTRPVSLFKTASTKVLGLFSKKSENHTYVPIPFSPPATPTHQGEEEFETRGRWCCARYTRSSSV